MHTRRGFIKKSEADSAGLALGVILLPNLSFTASNMVIIDPNERSNVAAIGVRSRAKSSTKAIAKYKEGKVAVTFDVDENILKKNSKFCQETLGYVPEVSKDFRKVLEELCISIPEEVRLKKIERLESYGTVTMKKVGSQNCKEAL